MSLKEKEIYFCPRTFIELQKDILQHKYIFTAILYVMVNSLTDCCVFPMIEAVAEAAVGRWSSSCYPAVVKKLMSDLRLKKI